MVNTSSRTPAFEQRFLDAGDVRLHYAELPGSGPAMILVHGIGMDWRVWQALSRRLRPSFHLYLVDLRGHGQSGKPARGYTLAHYAADLEDFIDSLKVTDVSLVGSSLGGMVAASVEAPSDVVTHRILVDPPLTGGPIRDAGMFRGILALKHDPVERLAGFLQKYNPRAERLYLRTMSEMWHEAADGVIEEMLDRPDDYYAIDPALEADTSPTLIMRADPDLGGVLSADEAERACRRLSRGSVVAVPGAGHAIHADRPEEFTQLVFQFTGVGDAAR